MEVICSTGFTGLNGFIFRKLNCVSNVTLVKAKSTNHMCIVLEIHRKGPSNLRSACGNDQHSTVSSKLLNTNQLLRLMRFGSVQRMQDGLCLCYEQLWSGIVIWCRPSPVQFSVSGPAGSMTIFFCLTTVSRATGFLWNRPLYFFIVLAVTVFLILIDFCEYANYFLSCTEAGTDRFLGVESKYAGTILRRKEN
jgi:hypothetical protein